MLDEHLNDVEVPTTSNALEAVDGFNAFSGGSTTWHTVELLSFFRAKMLRFVVILVDHEQGPIGCGLGVVGITLP